MINHEEILERFIAESVDLIAIDGVEGVKHYFEHGEYEMSFEGLVIELIKTNQYPSNFNFLEWKELAIYYRLNEDSVFDGDFWARFNEWGKVNK